MKKCLILIVLFVGLGLGYFWQGRKMNKMWYYQLQDYHPSLIVSSSKVENSIVVIDYSRDGSESARFGSQELDKLKEKGNKVFSYLSIGESEDYRFYHKTLPLDLVVAPNPDWPENRKVKYWDTRWQTVFLGKNGYLSKISKQGFDGVYLDIVDAYQSFPYRKTAAKEMVNFVAKISEKITPGKVIVQNASCLWKHAEEKTDIYFNSIAGIALESTFFIGKKFQDNDLNPQEEVIECVKEFIKRKKFVLAVEYVSSKDHVAKARELFKKNGYIGLVTDRLLRGKYFY